MVSHEERRLFEDKLREQNISQSVMIDDVEKVIREQKAKAERRSSERRLHDWRETKIAFNLAKYHSFAEV